MLYRLLAADTFLTSAIVIGDCSSRCGTPPGACYSKRNLVALTAALATCCKLHRIPSREESGSAYIHT